MKRSILILLSAPLAALDLNGEEADQVPPHTINRASESKLPAGNGIAAAFTFDKGVAGHPSVIFADNFEGEKIGEKWDEMRDDAGAVLSRIMDGPDQGHCLKVAATLGKNTGGGMTKWFDSASTLFIRFYTKFDSNCDYVHHFCTLRANSGLKGRDRWSGFGGAGERPDPRRRFSTALEPWGNWGRFEPPGQWNFYSYWHGMKASPDGKFWGNSFRPEGQRDISRGVWICAEFMLKHNTPATADGEQAFWIDGVLKGHWKAIRWRDVDSLKANAFTLESYVTDRWTKQRHNTVYFDNVVIASEYVGPLSPRSAD